MNALATRDVDLLAKILTQPDAVTIDESRTVAEKLGFKGGFLAAAINTAVDPLVWLSAFMSRKFPTHAFLTGKVPQRFIGTANEFSGASLVGRPVEDFFRGTNISKLTALAQHRQATVIQKAAPMLEIMNRPNWKQEMPIVSLILEGAAPTGATPELRQVAETIRSNMDEMWTYLHKTKRIHGGTDEGTYAEAEDWLPSKAPKYLRNYLPHIPLMGNESVFELSGIQALERLGGNRNRTLAHALRLKGESVGDVWRSDPASPNALVSEFGRFQRWITNVGAEVYNPHLFKRLRYDLKLHEAAGQQLFYTDLNLVLQKYVASVAKSYSLNAPLTPIERVLASTEGEFGRRYPSDSPIMAQIINEGLDATGVKVSERQVKGTNRIVRQVIPGTGNAPMLTALNTLVRSVKGSMAEDEILFGSMYSRVFGAIDKLKGSISKREQSEMTDAVGAVMRQRDFRRRADGIANYFYVSTLGLNPISAIRNLLQPIITTAPAIGIGSTIAGYKEFGSRVQGFFSEIAATSRSIPANFKGARRAIETAEQAFQKHFPELVKHRLDVDPRLFDISEEALQKRISPDGKFIDKDSFFKLLMAPFTGTEIANRAVTYYGAKNAVRHAIRAGEYPLPTIQGRSLNSLELEQLVDFEAASVTSGAQFTPGPGSKTWLQSVMPAALRQFTSFPIRLGNFFLNSTVRGAMTQAQLNEMSTLEKLLTLNGRNLGTVARAVLFGKIANNGLRDVLGVDVSGAVGLSALSSPVPDDQPFAPLPLPPLPSAILGTISAFSTRDIRKLQPLQLPGGVTLPIPRTLFPGGVGLNRLFRAVNQWQPDSGGMVDENERLLLKGDTTDLVLQMLGVPLDKMKRERQLMERLYANRAVIRDYGRKMKLAASKFDFGTMDVLRAEYSKLFPDMPQLAVSERDLDRFEAGQRMTRTQRMLQTLPAGFQTMNQGVIYDIDQDLIAEPNPIAGMLSAG